MERCPMSLHIGKIFDRFVNWSGIDRLSLIGNYCVEIENTRRKCSKFEIDFLPNEMPVRVASAFHCTIEYSMTVAVDAVTSCASQSPPSPLPLSSSSQCDNGNSDCDGQCVSIVSK